MKKDSDNSPHDHATRKSIKSMGTPKKPGMDELKARRAMIKQEIAGINAAMKAGKRK